MHRDIKPANLLLPTGASEQVKILDFGIARRQSTPRSVTQTGLVVGTPEYMAPEQARGLRDLTTAVDVFALGCIFYECLTGEAPFAAEHITAALARILFEEPRPLESRLPDLPPALALLCSRMLAKRAEDRFAGAGDVLRALADLGPVQTLQPNAAQAMAAYSAAQFAEAEQVLTSLVVAVVGNDAALSATQPAQNSRIDEERRQALLQDVQQLGVRAEFVMSGALMATVQSRDTATDQVSRAARVALLIKDRWPEAEIVLATGRGLAGGAGAVGEVADRAALLRQRLLRHGGSTDDARPGVWLDELSARLVGARFVVKELDGRTLLLSELKDTDAGRPLLGKPTPCIGREPELALLEGQLDASIDFAEARVMVILAPPGVGKSRLCHELRRRVEKRGMGVQQIVARTDPMQSGTPHSLVCQVIRRACGMSSAQSPAEQRQRLWARIGDRVEAAQQHDVALFLMELLGILAIEDGQVGLSLGHSAAPHGEHGGHAAAQLMATRRDPKRLAEAICGAFTTWLRAECQAAPVLLMLEDLQWADALSIALFDQALGALATAPLFLLALGRPETTEAFPRLWTRHKPQLMTLKGLSKKSSERLIQQVLGKALPPHVLTRVVEQAAGNALYLEEPAPLHESINDPAGLRRCRMQRSGGLIPVPSGTHSAYRVHGRCTDGARARHRRCAGWALPGRLRH